MTTSFKSSVSFKLKPLKLSEKKNEIYKFVDIIEKKLVRYFSKEALRCFITSITHRLSVAKQTKVLFDVI